MQSLGAAVLVVLLPLFFIFGLPSLWNALGSVAGSYLRRKTDGRRSKILEVIEEDEKRYAENKGKKGGDSRDEEDGGWEKVQAYSASSTPNADKSTEDWSGIVGFFHPFWYANSSRFEVDMGR